MKRIILAVLLCTIVLFSGCTNRTSDTSSSQVSSSAVGATDTPSSENNNSADESNSELLKQANIITHQLITYSFNQSVVDGNPPSDWAINSFILTVPVVKEPDYMYKELVGEAALYEYPKKSVQQIVYEVFGVDNWMLEGGDVEYDDIREVYTSSLAFGIGRFLSCADISSTLSPEGTMIVSKFQLTDNIGFKGEPGWEEHGEYIINFQIMKNGDREFLRFVNIEKA